MSIARRRYPALSDPEIFKLGLSKVATEYDEASTAAIDRDVIRRGASYAVGHDYLADEAEDIYTGKLGKQVNFS